MKRCDLCKKRKWPWQLASSQYPDRHFSCEITKLEKEFLDSFLELLIALLTEKEINDTQLSQNDQDILERTNLFAALGKGLEERTSRINKNKEV